MRQGRVGGIRGSLRQAGRGGAACDKGAHGAACGKGREGKADAAQVFLKGRKLKRRKAGKSPAGRQAPELSLDPWGYLSEHENIHHTVH